MGAAVWKKLCLNIDAAISSSISSKVSWCFPMLSLKFSRSTPPENS